MLVELGVVEQRYRAVLEVLDEGASVTDVARRYGVARQTVHGWLRRYANDGGLGGLADLSSRPDSCPHQMPAAIERAHLTGRHHLVIILAAALRRAFPHVPFFAAAASQVSCLVEMAADDAAARRAHRLTLADALLTLAAAGFRRGPRRRRNSGGEADPAPHRLTAARQPGSSAGHFRRGADCSTGCGVFCARPRLGVHLPLPARRIPFPPGLNCPPASARRRSGIRPGFTRITHSCRRQFRIRPQSSAWSGCGQRALRGQVHGPSAR